MTRLSLMAARLGWGLCAAASTAFTTAWAANADQSSWSNLPPPDVVMLVGAAGSSVQPCPEGMSQGVLGLAEVVARALCNDPRTRQAWARVQVEAAQVDTALTAYRPTLSADVEVARSKARLQELDADEPERGLRGTMFATLEFSWLLFDFGQRDAVTEAAQQTLLAATATHDANLQAVLLDASDAYYALVNAQSARIIASEDEKFAMQMLDEATNRDRRSTKIDRVDQLEAQVAIAQAALDKRVAEGNERRASGRLAALIGQSPDTPVAVDPDAGGLPDATFSQAVGELLGKAQKAHPSIRAAQARARAARADVEAARLTNQPRLSLVMSASRARDVFSARVHDRRIGLQLSIPLFDGYVRDARRRGAAAEFLAASADVQESERTVALEVWDAYESLQAEAATFDKATRVLQASQELLQVQQSRYRGEGPRNETVADKKAGKTTGKKDSPVKRDDEDDESYVPDLLDVLDAHRSLSESALQQRQALANWRAARMRLAASLGQLGLWSVPKP